MINPNTNAFVQALRAGKHSSDALVEYCWASMTVPIDAQQVENGRDPMDCSPAYNLTMSAAMGADAFDDGATDEEVAAAFERGRAEDKQFGVLWRVTRKDERPSPGNLLLKLSPQSFQTAAKLMPEVVRANRWLLAGRRA